jgi:hypothetical protein
LFKKDCLQGAHIYDDQGNPVELKDIKSFIHSAFKEMLEECLPPLIDHRKPHIKESKSEFNKNRGHNSCRQEFLTNLKEKYQIIIKE